MNAIDEAIDEIKQRSEFTLKQYRNAIIEECARVAESEDFADYLHPQPAIAAAIRALRDKP